MNQEKIGKFIKTIRLKNNLTQSDFAKTLGVTYQAVSKWETGKNMPDVAILQQISEQYNVPLNELLAGKKTNSSKKYYLIIILIVIVIVGALLLIYFFHHDNFEFKTLDSSCKDFKLTGSAAYNNNKTSLYLSNIDYCGEEDKTEYLEISCTLYEEYKNTIIKIATEETKNSTLDDFLNKVQFNIADYSPSCKSINESNLYLEINAQNKEEKIATYKIPIELKDC